nr:unnamed protein product [Digitaria exilis]
MFNNRGPLYFVKTKAYFSKMGLVVILPKFIVRYFHSIREPIRLQPSPSTGHNLKIKSQVSKSVWSKPSCLDVLREGLLGDCQVEQNHGELEILVSKVLKGDLQALEDLTYEKRKEFLQQHPLPLEVPIVSFHTEASITPSVLAVFSHVAHLELPIAADGNSTRIPVVMPLSAAMAACS